MSTDISYQDRAKNFDAKVHDVFGNLVIDKRRLPSSQLNKRNVPAYVAEWILDTLVPGEGSLASDETQKVQEWADRYIPLPSESNVIKNRLLNGELVRVLTVVEVEIKLTKRVRERVAHLKLIGINDAYIPDGVIEAYPDLLKQGMWGVTELFATQDEVAIMSFKPMQASVNLDAFKKARSQFSLTEWHSLLLSSMGYNPQTFSETEKTFLLSRLLPLVEKNLHLLELAPKGTGKSYLYENINPRVRLLSGGNVSPAVLFVNNASGQWGLLARFDVVVLDEIQTLRFEKPQEVVGGLKGFLANGRLTRGGLYETSSGCSLVMLANILLDKQQRPIVYPLVKELPDFLQETAFLDRLRGIIPGWKVRKLSSESFSQGIGLKSDFFGDALLALREDLSADQYCAHHIQLRGDKVYKRNDDAVRVIASALLKLQFPDCNVSDEDFEAYCVRPAVQLRQLVWEQLQTLDAEYRQYESKITYEILPGKSGAPVKTQEEEIETAIERQSEFSISDIVNQGENESLEFKSTLQWDTRQNIQDNGLRKPVLKTIVAFLNSQGGTLLIGVNDNGEVYGIEKDLTTLRNSTDRFASHLTSLFTQYIGAEYALYIKIRFESVDGKQVCVIQVKQSSTPVYFKSKQGYKFYARFGPTSRELDTKETVAYIKANWK